MQHGLGELETRCNTGKFQILKFEIGASFKLHFKNQSKGNIGISKDKGH